MAGDDRDDIERKTDALQQASAAIMQKSQQQSAGGGDGASPGAGAQGATEPGAEAKKDDVLDAEFEEVKESDRKKA
jgi:molecular chaperone DnaK